MKELTNTNRLVDESRSALQSVRSSLIELYDALGANPQTPQVVARSFKINRNLTWKLSRVMEAPDPFAALNHLPGQRSFELAMGAFQRAGAPARVVGSARTAMRSLLEVARVHAGDRAHLELTLESMGLFQREASAESGRELAFRGNSSVWGVQAKTRTVSTFLAPGQAPGTVDYLNVAGFVGVRRLRSTVQWQLCRLQTRSDSGKLMKATNPLEEIEPKAPGELPLVMREFCSSNMPDLLVEEDSSGIQLCLPSGEVGNRAAFDFYFGYIYRGLPNRASPENRTGATAVAITLPVESLLFDLILHKDVVFPSAPEVCLYGFPHGGPDNLATVSDRNRLPNSDNLVELAGSPPAVATPIAPRLNRLVDRVYERMSWNPLDFRGLRLQMQFPPMSGFVVIRWPLPSH